MKLSPRPRPRYLVCGFFAAWLLISLGCGRRPTAEVSIRVGWPTTWATQGQFTQALDTSGALQRNKLKAEFTSFPSGPEELEAAKGGSLDVVSAAAQPILQLVAQSSNWVIVSRNAYVRVAILVPTTSTAKTLKDLSGGQLGLPIGTTAENFVLSRSAAEGVKPSDIRMVNMDIATQGEFAKLHRGDWGDVRGLVTWEPTVTLLEDSGVAMVLEESNDLTLTAMSKKFIDRHPAEAVAYMRACLQAWAYYANHKSDMNDSYVKAAKLPLTSAVLDRVAANEPNANAKSARQVDISLTPQMLQHITDTLSLLVERGRLRADPAIQDIVNRDLLEEAKASLK